MPCFPVFEDTQGTVQILQNPVLNSNSKHIDVRRHFLREVGKFKEGVRAEEGDEFKVLCYTPE